jgi:hypothetical protein
MTAHPNQADTPMRWFVRTAGHRDAHHGALAMNGTVVEPGPLRPAAPSASVWVSVGWRVLVIRQVGQHCAGSAGGRRDAMTSATDNQRATG